MGYAGQVSLGHAAFFGLGAYASAILTVKLGVSPWLAMVAGVVVTAALAYLIATRSSGCAGTTWPWPPWGWHHRHLAFGEFRELTGGPTGLPGMPRLTIGSFVFAGDMEYYYLVWAVLCSAHRPVTQHRQFTRRPRVARDPRQRAGGRELGVDAGRYKLQVLVLSAVYASVAGSLYVHYMIFVSPQPFDFGTSVRLVVMAAVGGLASVWGAPFGAVAVTCSPCAARGAAAASSEGRASIPSSSTASCWWSS